MVHGRVLALRRLGPRVRGGVRGHRHARLELAGLLGLVRVARGVAALCGAGGGADLRDVVRLLGRAHAGAVGDGVHEGIEQCGYDHAAKEEEGTVAVAADLAPAAGAERRDTLLHEDLHEGDVPAGVGGVDVAAGQRGGMSARGVGSMCLAKT